MSGAPRCADCGETPTVQRTSLCETHYRAAIDRVRASLAERKAPRSVSPSKVPRPEPVTIDPADVFAATTKRVPAELRAAWMGRWVQRIGRPVTRADAVRVVGLDPLGSGPARGVLATATERGYIRRGVGGCVLPGDVTPPPA